MSLEEKVKFSGSDSESKESTFCNQGFSEEFISGLKELVIIPYLNRNKGVWNSNDSFESGYSQQKHY